MCLSIGVSERDKFLDDFWFFGFYIMVDGDIVYELGNIGSCMFDNKDEVFGFGLVEFEVFVELCGNG